MDGTMRTCCRLLVLCVVTIAVIEAYPQRQLSRSKRGFKADIRDRIAHGFGKRNSRDNLLGGYAQDDTRDIMTVEELTDNLIDNPELTEAIVRKFVDANGDGVVTVDELLEKPLV